MIAAMSASPCAKYLDTHPTRVFIVEDYRAVRISIAMLIDRQPDCEVCGAVESAFEALAGVQRARADIVLVDVSLPDLDGIVLVSKLLERNGSLKAIMCSGYGEPDQIRRAFAAGASGYVNKLDSNIDLPRAIAAVREGQRFLSQALAL